MLVFLAVAAGEAGDALFNMALVGRARAITMGAVCFSLMYFWWFLWIVDGDPYGTRTRVFAVKGRRPRPLDEGAVCSVKRASKQPLAYGQVED